MKVSRISLVVLLFGAGSGNGIADTVNLPSIEITATPIAVDVTQIEPRVLTVTDSAVLLKNLPGANVNQNGPLTGIAQYRGYFGDRVNTQINGVHIEPACSNAMDTPLSYLPPATVQHIELQRGIAPVSSGIETIGSAIRAISLSSEFSAQQSFVSSGKVTAGYTSVSDGNLTSVFSALSNQSHRFHASANRERGNDYDYPDGSVSPTEYKRDSFGLGYGFRGQGGGEFDIDYHRDDTDNSGTPALPMDIVYADGEVLAAGYRAPLGNGTTMKARVDYQDSNHAMDNFSLRTPPTMMGSPMLRRSDTDVISTGFQLKFATPLWHGVHQFGLEGDVATHNANIIDPANANFLVRNFNDAERNLLSLFSEWQGDVADGWNLKIGGQITQVEMDADTVASSRSMMNPNLMALQNRFNSADRSQTDYNGDLAVELRHLLNQTTDLIVGFGHKNRAPSYQERYLWAPLEATAGLADGNVYVGDIRLDPESANQLEFGFDWTGASSYLNPRIFYHRIDDYIQGTPATDAAVLAVNSTALQFSNVDAEMYGFDLGWGVAFNSQWRADGVVSYTRGKRRDIGDELFRIAPLNGSLSLTHSRQAWEITLEEVAYAAQNKVSTTNREQKSAGYMLTNLRLRYQPKETLTLGFGVENLFDKQYQPHLGGTNRVIGSDLAVGEKIYGPGVNVYANVSLEW